MTSFADALAQSRKSPGVPCSFADLRESLSKKDQADLDTALALPLRDMPHTQIAAALSIVVGKKIDTDIIGRHRRGDCRQCSGS